MSKGELEVAWNAGWEAARGWREDLSKADAERLRKKGLRKFLNAIPDADDVPPLRPGDKLALKEETPTLDRQTFMYLMAEFIGGMDDGNGAYVRAHMDTAFFNMFKLSREKI